MKIKKTKPAGKIFSREADLGFLPQESYDPTEYLVDTIDKKESGEAARDRMAFYAGLVEVNGQYYEI